jgi:hypothetical protein
MKVRVEVTVEVDAEAWAYEYGLEESEVREDFKNHAAYVLWELAGQSPESAVGAGS